MNNAAVNTATLRYLVHNRFYNKPDNGFHTLRDWSIVKDANTETLVEHLKQGRSVLPALVDSESFLKLRDSYRPRITIDETGKEAIKDWSVSGEEIIATDIIAIDIDTVPVDEVPIEFREWCFYAYASPSAVMTPKGWSKSRWLIKLEFPIDSDKIANFRSVFFDQYVPMADRAMERRHQIIYGRDATKNPDIVILENHKATLPFSIQLEVSSNILDQVIRVIPERNANTLTAKLEIAALDSVDNDLEKLIESLFPDYEWNPKSVLNEPATIEKIVCCNPFSETNSTGSSGCWQIRDDGSIRFLDRANNRTYTLASFTYAYQQLIEGKTIPDKATLSESLKGETFSQIVDQIGNSLGIEINKPIELSETEFEPPTKYIKKIFHDLEGQDKPSYWCYDLRPGKHVWRHLSNMETIRAQTIVPYLVMTGQMAKLETVKGANGKAVKDENGNTVKRERTITEREKMTLVSDVLSSLENFPEYHLDCVPSRNREYIGFANGDFNLVTRELEEFSPDHNLVSRFKQPYELRDRTIVNQFESVLTKYFQCDIKAKLFVNYCISIFQNRAYQIQHILFLIGEAGTCKTSVVDIFRKIYDRSGTRILKLNGEDFSNKFGLENLNEATQMITVNELASLWGNLAQTRIKQGWGTDETAEGALSVERKGFGIFNIERDYGLIADRQDLPTMPPNDDGLKRRVIFLRNPWQRTAHNQHLSGIIDQNVYQEMLKTILNQFACFEFFLSAIAQNADEALAEFNQLTLSPVFAEETKNVSNQNDPYIEFINEELEICEDSEVYTITEDIYDRMGRYFGNQIPKGSPLTIKRNLRQSLYKLYPQLKTMQPNQNNRWINDKTVNVIVGVKLRESPMPF